jgi:hypothetical protein
VTTPIITPMEQRVRDAATQLASLAGFVRNTPGVKVSPHTGATVYYFARNPAEVDEIAAALGTKADWNLDQSHYRVVVEVGEHAKYEAVWVKKYDPEPQPEGQVPA